MQKNYNEEIFLQGQNFDGSITDIVLGHIFVCFEDGIKIREDRFDLLKPEEPLIVEVLRDRGIVSIISDADAVYMFEPLDPINCPVKRYDVLNSQGDTFTIGTPMYERLLLDSRFSPGFKIKTDDDEAVYHDLKLRAVSAQGYEAIKDIVVVYKNETVDNSTAVGGNSTSNETLSNNETNDGSSTYDNSTETSQT